MDTTNRTFIEKAKQKHNNIFDYSLVNYKNSITKVKIICKEHGEFEQTPNNHLNGQKCPHCNGNAKLNTEKFIEKSLKIHNKYNYSSVNYKNNKTKVKIVCKEHGIFEQTPNNHLLGQGCPKCDFSVKLNTNDFIKKCINIHKNKYDYSLVDYKNSNSMLHIICEKHGTFKQYAKNHLAGYGCQICAGNKKPTTDEFIEKSNIVHNFRYDYSNTFYSKALSKVKIICREHGEFEQTPNKHLNGRGCQICGLKYGIMENKWLDDIGIKKSDRQIRINNYIVDGIDREKNTIYEFNGDFWHGNPAIFDKNLINTVIGKKFGELYNNTLIKENCLKELGYNIISIWESDYLNKNMI
jgi:hypothetical protein